jgi:uncharacterized protein YgiM (DUF1202 family)
LIFQDFFGQYFGIDISGAEEGNSAELILEDDLKKIITSPKNIRYSFKDNFLLDRDILLSMASSTAFEYMSSLPFFDSKKYSYLSDSDFVPLPNGRFLYTDFRECWIFDTDGRPLEYTIFQNKPDYYKTSNFIPASDGYIYYLHADFKNQQTIVYRLGPYSELMLGYGGTGGIINDDHVNVRENPDTNSAVLTQVSKGTPARILDKTAKPETIGGQTTVWYNVRLWDRTEGWIFGAFLDIQK